MQQTMHKRKNSKVKNKLKENVAEISKIVLINMFFMLSMAKVGRNTAEWLFRNSLPKPTYLFSTKA